MKNRLNILGREAERRLRERMSKIQWEKNMSRDGRGQKHYELQGS